MKRSDDVCSDGVVLCAFWRESRSSFGVRVCDDLVKGVPACVVADFYPDPCYEEETEVKAWLRGEMVVICPHFVRSDVLRPDVKHGCYFGGDTCFHSDVEGFGACVGCCRFVRS